MKEVAGWGQGLGARAQETAGSIVAHVVAAHAVGTCYIGGFCLRSPRARKASQCPESHATTWGPGPHGRPA
eukprot:11349896-Alexandrium_andersonii.AAC.1